MVIDLRKEREAQELRRLGEAVQATLEERAARPKTLGGGLQSLIDAHEALLFALGEIPGSEPRRVAKQVDQHFQSIFSAVGALVAGRK